MARGGLPTASSPDVLASRRLDLDDGIVVAPDAWEPNNLRDQATVIDEGIYFGPTVGEVGDVGWYRIDPVPTGFLGFFHTVFVEVEEDPSSSCGTLFVRLEDEDGNVPDEDPGEQRRGELRLHDVQRTVGAVRPGRRFRYPTGPLVHTGREHLGVVVSDSW